MNAHIDIPHDKIASFCKRWQVTELALFGSVLRDDFGPDSDVDVLARFEEEARHTLFDLDRMEEELTTVFRRKVDLVSWQGVEQSHNYIRRKAILESAETIYAASSRPFWLASTKAKASTNEASRI
ncbi:MAG: nucleotidyltransferase family protein [Nitrospira sp.]|nr:nucleotidyltransferase family protein [Nitrospira sp.]MDE0485503.1 nucleotidyltransferase family protein [Nitrospira sp.]